MGSRSITAIWDGNIAVTIAWALNEKIVRTIFNTEINATALFSAIDGMVGQKIAFTMLKTFLYVRHSIVGRNIAVIIGAIGGGSAIGFSIRQVLPDFTYRNIIIIILGWAIGMHFIFALVLPIKAIIASMLIGWFIGGLVTSFTIRFTLKSFGVKHIMIVASGWGIARVIGFFSGRSIGNVIGDLQGFQISSMMSWAIGAFIGIIITFWQIHRARQLEQAESSYAKALAAEFQKQQKQKASGEQASAEKPYPTKSFTDISGITSVKEAITILFENALDAITPLSLSNIQAEYDDLKSAWGQYLPLVEGSKEDLQADFPANLQRLKDKPNFRNFAVKADCSGEQSNSGIQDFVQVNAYYSGTFEAIRVWRGEHSYFAAGYDFRASRSQIVAQKENNGMYYVERVALGNRIRLSGRNDCISPAMNLSKYTDTYVFDFETHNVKGYRFGYTLGEVKLLKQKLSEGDIFKIHAISKDANQYIFELVEVTDTLDTETESSSQHPRPLQKLLSDKAWFQLEGRPAETEKELEYSGGTSLEQLMAELVQIGRNEQFISASSAEPEKYDAKFRHIRAREIGVELDRQGGMDALKEAHHNIELELGNVRARELESAWDGIGEWWG